MSVQLHLGDCLDFMRTLPTGSVDAVVTDPPYGIDADKRQNENAGHKGGKRGGHYKRYSDTNWDNSIPEKVVFDEIFRVSDNQIIFGGNYFTEFLYPSRCWIIWDKVVRGGWPDGEMAWASYDKGLRIFEYSRADAYINSLSKKEHPTQKPLALMRWIIENYTKPGDTVIDPFMGSGTTGVGCVQTGRNFIGCEIDAGYFKIAQRRIKDAQQQPLLPFMTNGHEPRHEQLSLEVGE